MVEENDPDDQDEIKMNQRRLQKTLAEIKIKNQSFLQVQGQSRDDGSEHTVVLQVQEKPSMEADHQCLLVKKGSKNKAKAAKPEESKQAADTKDIKKGLQDIEISSDDCLLQHTEAGSPTDEFFKVPQKRSSQPADDDPAASKRQKVAE